MVQSTEGKLSLRAGKSFLIVEDWESQRQSLRETIKSLVKEADIDSTDHKSGAIKLINEKKYAFVILDLDIFDSDKNGYKLTTTSTEAGLQVLKHIEKRRKENKSSTPIVIVLTHLSAVTSDPKDKKILEQVVESGAYFFPKSAIIDDPSRESGIVTDRGKDIFGIILLQQDIHIIEQSDIKNSIIQSLSKTHIVGESPLLKQALEMLSKVAQKDTTVLLQGESGTGKELFAKKCHELSPRNGHPFVPVNCASIPNELLENELFGSEKGVYTSSVRTIKGQCEIADGGTLFLDEIGEFNLKVQPKILRFLQDKTFKRLGGKEISVNVRVVAATNKDLQKEVELGRFRKDLFYRLKVFPIELPPLRKRKEDIPILIDHHLRKQKCDKAIAPAALDKLKDYDWPGNIRELESIIEQAIIISERIRIEPSDIKLPKQARQFITDTLELRESRTTGNEEFPQLAIVEKLFPKYERRLQSYTFLCYSSNSKEKAKARQGLKRYLISKSTSKDKSLKADYLRSNIPIIKDIQFQIRSKVLTIHRSFTPRSFEKYISSGKEVIAERDSERNLLWHLDSMIKSSKEDLYEVCCSQLIAEVIKKNIPAEPLIADFPFKFKIEHNIVTPNGDKTLEEMLSNNRFKNNQSFAIYVWFLYLLNFYLEIYQ